MKKAVQCGGIVQPILNQRSRVFGFGIAISNDFNIFMFKIKLWPLVFGIVSGSIGVDVFSRYKKEFKKIIDIP